MAKLTVSLSQTARDRIDRKAGELGLTRIAYVEQLVIADSESELERLLEEGYRATSADNLAFAELSVPLAMEVMSPEHPAR